MTVVPAADPKCSLGYACPRCRRSVAHEGGAYVCAGCGSRYPVVLGIPDFRVFPDPWIGLEDDRQKARCLDERARGGSLESMVRTYWAMTPGTPAAQADRFVEHVLHADARSREWVDRMPPASAAPASAWLDIGTGTGDLAVVAAERGASVVGIDIAMRWMVVARRRAELAGVGVDLVCCNAEHLPFADATFARATAVGTIEHLGDADTMLRETRRVLRRGGDLRVRTVNRYTMLPEPHVDVWGVGYVPRRLADRYVHWRSGQRYEHHRPLSSRELRRGLQLAGFRDVSVEAAPLLATERARLAHREWAANLYERSRRAVGGRTALRLVAPLLEASGVAS
jgi:ubiquinone/menaquinone biosynthesis C-methylase UbiE